MNDRTAVLLGVLAGAVAGGVASFLFFTERGRQLREDLEPRLRDVVEELQKARATAARATAAVTEAWPPDAASGPFPDDQRGRRAGGR